MARHGGYRIRGVVSSFSKKVQTELGLLALYHQQRAVDHLGLARWGLRAHLSSSLPRFP